MYVADFHAKVGYGGGVSMSLRHILVYGANQPPRSEHPLPTSQLSILHQVILTKQLFLVPVTALPDLSMLINRSWERLHIVSRLQNL